MSAVGYADLHIHTTASDSSYSPAEVVARAVRNHVTLMAVCDHNVIAGSLAAEPLAREAGISFVRGVEIDALYAGRDVHMLAYHPDFENKAFRELIAHARYALDHMSEVLLERLKDEFPTLDMAEYRAFAYDPDKGGWPMLQYLLFKGVTGSIHEGMALYPRYDVTYAGAGFVPLDEVIGTVHAAGGVIVVAHPCETFKRLDDSDVLALVGGAIDAGADGIECYYPTQGEALTHALVDLARRRNLKITAGSDCHGAFGKTDVGEMRVDASKIRL